MSKETHSSAGSDDSYSEEERMSEFVGSQRACGKGKEPLHCHPGAKRKRKASGRDERSLQELEDGQMEVLLAAISESKKSVDRQLEAFRKEIHRTSTEATEKLERRLKTSKTIEFKRKGNEKQYGFNEEVDRHLSRAQEELGSAGGGSPIKRAKEAVEEGRQALANRQKLILLADRSEFGWDVARKYEADELAEDSEDEKKIRKVEKEAQKDAERRAASRRKATRGGKRPTPYQRPVAATGHGPSWGEQRLWDQVAFQ